MNRLNFSHMVSKNLNNFTKPIPLNSTQVFDEDFYEQERYDAKLKHARQQNSLGKKLDGMITQVYEQLSERQNSPNRPKSQQSVLDKKNLSKQKKPIKSPPSKIPKRMEKANVRYLSIPRLKVEKTCKEKQKRESERKSLKEDVTDYENYKRMSKAFERHVELENMLAHHRHLREHRQAIAYEVFAMRHSLDDIKHRLKNSFRILDNNKTYTECQRLEKSAKSKKCISNEKESISTV